MKYDLHIEIYDYNNDKKMVTNITSNYSKEVLRLVRYIIKSFKGR